MDDSISTLSSVSSVSSVSSALSTVSQPTSLSLISIFGPPPLIDGEDAKAYDELLLQASSDVGPRDFIEEIWVRDVVDLTWEVIRLRRLKVHLISGKVLELIKVRLARIIKRQEDLDELVALWKAQEPSAIKRVREYLASTGETLEEVAGHALTNQIGYIRRIEEFTVRAEDRRNATLREIDRHRAVLAQRLRDKVQQIEDAEFKAVEHKAISQAEPAAKAAP